MESWSLLSLERSDGVEHVLSHDGISVIIWMDSVMEEFWLGQIVSSESRKVVDDVALIETQFLADHWDKLVKGVVENALSEMANAFDIEWWWDHEEDLWLGLKFHE
jgi:hypothetical protein